MSNEITNEEAKEQLKKEYDIPDIIMQGLEKIGYNFKMNHSKFPYAYILEWMCEYLLKQDKSIELGVVRNKPAHWSIAIPFKNIEIYESKLKKKIRNKTLRKFIEQLSSYHMIEISLNDKIMKIDDDYICWGFEDSIYGREMVVMKDKKGNYNYQFKD